MSDTVRVENAGEKFGTVLGQRDGLRVADEAVEDDGERNARVAAVGEEEWALVARSVARRANGHASVGKEEIPRAVGDTIRAEPLSDLAVHALVASDDVGGVAAARADVDAATPAVLLPFRQLEYRGAIGGDVARAVTFTDNAEIEGVDYLVERAIGEGLGDEVAGGVARDGEDEVIAAIGLTQWAD